MTHLQPWKKIKSSRVPDLPAGQNHHECSVGMSADNPIQIHDEPPQMKSDNGPLCFEENGVETEVSSFSFKLRIPKGMRPLVHDELILRGLASPDDACRSAANDLLKMKQAHRSYTQNQLRRRENKFMDTFRSGRNFPTPDDLEKDLYSPHKPLRDAARSLFMNKMNKNRPLVETVQEYNKGLIDQYRKVQINNNVRQGILERKEANMAKKRGPQISSAVSWDPELWEAVDCEDPYVKMWAENYHKLLRRNVPSCHPDMIVVVKALNSALKEYNERMKKEVQKEKEKLEEMNITKELRELYLVQQGRKAARAPEAQLSALQREQPEATLARPPSPTPISGTPEGTDEDEIPMLVAEAMEDFAPDNILNKGNLDLPLKQESEQE